LELAQRSPQRTPADKVESLIKLTECDCVVYQTLKTPANLALSVGTTA
jgi:hypothetical protein